MKTVDLPLLHGQTLNEMETVVVFKKYMVEESQMTIQKVKIPSAVESRHIVFLVADDWWCHRFIAKFV